jgi:outer membrane protein TolC
MTRFPVLLVLAAVSAAAEQPTLPSELALSQALNLALTNSSTIRTAMARLDEASGRSQQSRSPLLPQVNIGARQAYQTVNLIGMGIDLPFATGVLGPFGSMDARVFVSQQLLNISQLRASKSARVRQDSSRLLVQNARDLVALSVVATYLDALRAKATRDTLVAQTKLADDLYNLTRDRVKQGAAAELDANRARQQVNTLEQQRQEAEHSYVAAKLSLANILQAHVTSQFEVVDSAAYGDGGVPDQETTRKMAIEARADYQSAEANVRAAELQVKSAKANRLPTIGVLADDGQSGSTPVHNVNTYRLMGSVSFPIFTGGRIRGEIVEAEGALREAQSMLEQNRSQIETDVLSSISGVEWALKEVETSASNAKLSREEVEFARARFAQGIADNTEVVNAQDRLSRADDSNIRARYALGLARANLARATGAVAKSYGK